MKARWHVVVVVALVLISAAAPAAGQEKGPTVTLSAAAYAGGILQPNETHVERKLTVDSSRNISIIVTSTASLKVSLQLPDGSVVSPDQRLDDRLKWYSFVGGEASQQLLLPGIGSGFNHLVTIDRPASGAYVVRLDQPQAIRVPIPFLVTLIQDSDVRMGLSLPFRDAVRAAPFVVAALLFDRDKPLRGANVLAKVTRTSGDPADLPIPVQELLLTDDGKGADAAPGDGIYTGIVAPTASGQHWIAIRATGKSPGGDPFERNAGTSFVVSEPTVRMNSLGPAEWLHVGRNPRVSKLSVPVDLRGPAGSYEVVVTIRASNGRLTAGNGLVEIGPQGRARLIVSINAERIKLLGVNGPYDLQSAEVFQLTKQDRVLCGRRLGTSKTPPLSLTSLDVR